MNASQMFEKAVLWNPAGVSAHLEYMAFLLYMKDFEGFERVARESFRYVYQKAELESLYYEIRLYMMEVIGLEAYTLSVDRINEVLKDSGYEVYSSEEIANTLLQYGFILEKDKKQALECCKAAFELTPREEIAERISKLQE